MNAAAVVGLVLAAGTIGASGQAPAWWTQRGVFTPGATPDDYAVANHGQLKNFAWRASQEMNAVLPGGAGGAVNQMIATWMAAPAQGVTRDDYSTVNVGQLKAVVRPFLERLIELGYADAPYVNGAPDWPFLLNQKYLWTGNITNTDPSDDQLGDDDDYAYANLGQLKFVFSFDLTLNSDDDSHPNWWERWQARLFPGSFNPLVTNPFVDTDGDGISDWDELRQGSNPNDASSSAPAPAAPTLQVYTPLY